MAQQQQQQNSDNSMAPVWIIPGVYHRFSSLEGWTSIYRRFCFLLNILQAKLVSLFITNPHLDSNVYLMQTIDPASVNWDQFIDLTRAVGDYIRYPVAVILVLLAFFLYKSNITLKFRKAHNMKTLRFRSNRTGWPLCQLLKKIWPMKTLVRPLGYGLNSYGVCSKISFIKKEDALLDTQCLD